MPYEAVPSDQGKVKGRDVSEEPNAVIQHHWRGEQKERNADRPEVTFQDPSECEEQQVGSKEMKEQPEQPVHDFTGPGDLPDLAHGPIKDRELTSTLAT
jgi:hypothetical protein